jgi:methylmalonyl-CoA/ethylmalonyl-CoA epimerase
MDIHPELDGLLQVAIAVKDLDRAVDFYRDKLAMTFLFKPAPTMAFLQCGATRVYLEANPTGVQAGGNSYLYFRAIDIDRAHANYKERGVEIQQAPHVLARLPDREVWLMWIKDSESNLIAVMQEKKPAPA